MSNSGISALTPMFWAMAFDQLDIGEFQFQSLVSRDLQNLVASKGETVRVPLQPDMGAADDYVPGSAITVQNVTQEYADLTLNKSKNKTFMLNDKERSMSQYDLLNIYGLPAAKALLKTANDDIYQELIKSHYVIDAISSLTEDKIIDATVQLAKNEVSKNGRTLVGSNEDYGAMMKLAGFKSFFESGDKTLKDRGVIGVKYGLEMRENNIISTRTPADLTGAVNKVGGYVAGDKTMIVDAFNDDTNPVRAGDVFTVAGETGSPQHTVQSTLVTTSDTTSITFEPALAGAVADDAVVTFVASKSMIAFVPNAAAFAARTYGALPEGAGVRSEVIVWNDLPIRISTWVADLVTKVQFDILYGTKLVNPKRAVRILRP